MNNALENITNRTGHREYRISESKIDSKNHIGKRGKKIRFLEK